MRSTSIFSLTRRSSLLVLMFSGLFWMLAGTGTGCAPAPVSEKPGESSTDGGSNKDSSSTDDIADTGGDGSSNPDKGGPDGKQPTDDPPGDDNPQPVKTECTTSWGKVTDTFKDATNLKSCDGNAAAMKVVRSLMNLNDVKIDNDGQTMKPCIETRCGDGWVYVLSNALPHYDFVQTTPNALKSVIFVYRVALKPQEIKKNVDADEIPSMQGCQDAYKQFLTNANTGTQQEPSGFCQMGRSGKSYMKETIDGRVVVYRKLSCLGTTGFVISGVPVFGPNEAVRPDPWGNPLYFSPDKAGQSYVPSNFRDGAALDMCLGHTAQSMHYHGVNEACFELGDQNKPRYSYAKATSTWDWKASLTDDCKKESGIVGWSSDGVPIKGACVCMKRNGDGSCAELKRVRSGFVYAGLKSWGSDPKEDASLGKEGKSCTQLSDCCTGPGKCRYQCKYAILDDSKAPGGTTASKTCVLRDYSWCIHRFKDRSKQNVSKVNFVYLDRCNGLKSADGYAYHVTAAFPLITSCFKFEARDAISGGGHGGNNNGGNQPKSCQRDNDCRGACPQGTRTCSCRQAPQGQQGKICVPTCQNNRDCPQQAQCSNGICQQGGGNQQGPKSCQSNNDCQGACSQGSKGCTCENSPNGKVCIPTCKQDSDCPKGGPRQLRCETRRGICVPSGRP